jgi:hypothetical protein
MKRVTIQDEYAVVLRLFHIQPFGSSLFCETCGNQAIKTGGQWPLAEVVTAAKQEMLMLPF